MFCNFLFASVAAFHASTTAGVRAATGHGALAHRRSIAAPVHHRGRVNTAAVAARAFCHVFVEGVSFSCNVFQVLSYVDHEFRRAAAVCSCAARNTASVNTEEDAIEVLVEELSADIGHVASAERRQVR